MNKSPFMFKDARNNEFQAPPHPGERAQPRVMPEMELRNKTPPPIMTIKPLHCEAPNSFKIKHPGPEAAHHPGEPARHG